MTELTLGTRFPIKTFAFSRLSARILGLAKMRASNTPLCAFSVSGETVAPTPLPRKLCRSASVSAAPAWLASGASTNLSGKETPSSCNRFRLTSSTSTSSITSASATSCRATNRSTSRMPSALSRTIRIFCRSSTINSRGRTIVRTEFANARTSAFVTLKALTESS